HCNNISRLIYSDIAPATAAIYPLSLHDALPILLEAANRCARALGSSLEMEQAFGAFIREVRGLVPFERTAIVLVENDSARTIATDRKSTRLNSSHLVISYAVFCLKKKKKTYKNG